MGMGWAELGRDGLRWLSSCTERGDGRLDRVIIYHVMFLL